MMIIKMKFTRKYHSFFQEGKHCFKKGMVPLNPLGVNDNMAAKAAVIATIIIRISIEYMGLCSKKSSNIEKLKNYHSCFLPFVGP